MTFPGSWRLWPRRHRRAVAKASAGYNLVVLAVAITVLNILVAKALPLWSHLIQREKEAELIFRGLQYAEAIRLFEGRAQRLPTRLEELIKVKPRCIRQLWENPMTEDGSWGLVFQDQPQPGQGQNVDRQGRPRPNQRQEGQNQQFSGLPRPGEEVRVGPIIGVFSPEGGQPILTFAPQGGGGGNDISQWKFTRDLLQGFANTGPNANPGQVAQNNLPQVPRMNAADIGKPWPPGISLPQTTGRQQQRQGPRGVGVPPPNPSNRTGGRPAGGNTPTAGRDLGGSSGRGGG